MMQPNIISLLSGLAVLSPLAVASPLAAASPNDQLLAPHSSYMIDLDDYEANSTIALTKRTDVKVCTSLSDPGSVGACAAVVGTASAIALGVAALLKSDSNNNDCTIHTGAVDGVAYSVFATGKNCDTTAQQSTISGALNNFIATVDENEICGVQCLKLSHGGTWSAYVLMGQDSYDLNNYSCDLAGTFGNCASGGENDN